MTNQQILDSIYLLPALIDFFEKPTKNTAAILKSYGITAVQVRELQEYKSLIQYHKEIVQNQFQPNYPLLRQGLVEYFNKYMTELFVDLQIVNEEALLLDYGCGAGHISDQFLKNNPNGSVIKIDKELICNNLVIDFETNPNWYHNYAEDFDYVLLSEVLHCKQLEVQKYLIESSYDLLKYGGYIIIIENIDPCMEYRIGKIKNEHFPVLNKQDIDKIIEEAGYKNKVEMIKEDEFVHSGLSLNRTIQINQHKIYMYAKV